MTSVSCFSVSVPNCNIFRNPYILKKFVTCDYPYKYGWCIEGIGQLCSLGDLWELDGIADVVPPRGRSFTAEVRCIKGWLNNRQVVRREDYTSPADKLRCNEIFSLDNHRLPFLRNSLLCF